MVLSAQELFAIENMATAGMGNKKITTTLGLPNEAVVAEAPLGEMVSHNVGRPRGVVAGVCVSSPCICCLTSRIASELFFDGADDEIRSVPRC